MITVNVVDHALAAEQLAEHLRRIAGPVREVLL